MPTPHVHQLTCHARRTDGLLVLDVLNLILLRPYELAPVQSGPGFNLVGRIVVNGAVCELRRLLPHNISQRHNVRLTGQLRRAAHLDCQAVFPFPPQRTHQMGAARGLL